MQGDDYSCSVSNVDSRSAVQQRRHLAVTHALLADEPKSLAEPHETCTSSIQPAVHLRAKFAAGVKDHDAADFVRITNLHQGCLVCRRLGGTG